MPFDFVRDQDKTIVIEVQVPRATRTAFRFPNNIPTNQIIISEKLLSFPGISTRKTNDGVRISFKTDPKFSYAYYKITPRMLAIGAGVSVGALAGIAAAIYLGPAVATGLGLIGLASTTSAFTIKAGIIAVSTTAALVTTYLVNKQMPKYVYSRDPKVTQFYDEIVIYNQRVYQDSSQQFSFWSVDDGDPKDLYRYFKVVKSTGEQVPIILNNLADATKDTASGLAELVKFIPYGLALFLGYKAYEKIKPRKTP